MIFLSVLPLITLFLLWLLLLSLPSEGDETDFSWRETLIKASLYWFVYFAVGTELLSLIKGLTTLGIVLLWSSAILALIVVAMKRKFLAKGWRKAKESVHFPNKPFEIALLICILVILVILLITGIMSPPNIHDVLTYHMTRVMHWIQDRSLAYFPTSITFQLWHPPFAEYNLLHWTLLTGNNYLSAFHQWYGLVLTLVAVGATAGKLGAKSKGQLVASLFYVTLPIVVLQTSGTKNDVFLGYLFAALCYFVVKAVKTDLKLSDWFGTAIAVGLGLLTKGSFAFFTLPMLAWLLVMVIKKAGVKRAVLFILLGLLVVSGLNAGYWARNILTFGNPLGTGSANYLMNSRFGLDVLVSNLSKNIALQLISVGYVNNFVNDALLRLHNMMGMNMFDPAITLGPGEFFYVPTREEVASNPLHFAATIFIIFILLIFMFRKKDKSEVVSPLILSLCAIIGMVLFSAIFRWQVWGSRYFVPYFVLFAPVVGYIFGRRLPNWMVGLLCVGLILWSVNPLINNYSKSFSWSTANRNSIWRMSRKGLLFANHQTYEGAILELTHQMDVSGCREYGLVFGKNVPEYLIWATLTPSASDYHLEHYAVDNATSILESPDFNPCGIIVFEALPSEFDNEGQFILADEWTLEEGGENELYLYLWPEYLLQSVE